MRFLVTDTEGRVIKYFHSLPPAVRLAKNLGNSTIEQKTRFKGWQKVEKFQEVNNETRTGRIRFHKRS